MKYKKLRVKKIIGGNTGSEKFIFAHLPFYLPPSTHLSSDWPTEMKINLLYYHFIKLSWILY